MKVILCLLSLFVVISGYSQDKRQTQIEFSGHVMTDMGYNFNQIHPDYFDVMRPTQLPAYKNEFGTDGNVFFGVRQSFLDINSYTSTKFGKLKIRIAFDLLGVGANSGTTTFHMLYAFAELGMFSIGHNWSLFSDIDGFPNMIEYWGPVGLSLCKNVQLRFIPLQGANRFAIALESPGASRDGGIYADRIELDDVEPKFNLPDLTAEFRLTRDWGYTELAGALRKIEWIDMGNQPFDLSGKVLGWGVNFSSNLKLNAKNVLVVQTIYGEGIQNLMNDAPSDIGIKNDFTNVNSPVKGVAIPLFSYSIYLNREWNKK